MEEIIYSHGRENRLLCDTLSSLSLYLMFILYLLRMVGLTLEHIQRNFLWDGGALK